MAERGRPKKPKAELRDQQFHIMLTKSEHGAIVEAAKSETAGTSTWARNVLMKAAKGKRGRVQE
jgi:hypothetical protein